MAEKIEEAGEEECQDEGDDEEADNDSWSMPGPPEDDLESQMLGWLA